MEPSREEREQAAHKLCSRLSHRDIDYFIGRYFPIEIFDKVGDILVGTKRQKALWLVEARGSELLADSELRKNLVAGDPGLITALAGPGEDAIVINQVAVRSWHPGKAQAKNFVEALGFPEIFAGMPSTPRPETLVDLEPSYELPPLLDFQTDVIEQIMEILELKNGHEAMVSLPTGAGKTRVAMEAIVQFQEKHRDGIILWLGTTGEVCEQACQSFIELRRARPPSVTQQLHRYWGSHELNLKFQRGIIVASVQKIRSQVEVEAFPYRFLRGLSAVFFDEGHHAVAPTYEATLDYLEEAKTDVQLPIIGLTATPGRGSDPSSYMSNRLAKRFGKRLLVPRGPGWDDPVTRLQQEGVLSVARAICVRTNRKYSLNAKMEKHWEEFREFSSELLQKMSNDVIRNAIIVKQICEHGTSRKGIVFTCSVAHAEHLTFLLRKAGRPAATISAETRPAIRQRNLELFKAGKLDFIVNFGILTTGFDVPSINIIVLARPVTSQVLYEQMLGRGLRGPKFGGTGECLILDFEDNIQSHGRPLAYSRFKWLWDTQ